jgi:phenylacetate-CoA ligase
VSNLTLIKSFLSLKLNEKRSRESILRLREKKFRRILKYAYENSRFYYNLYKSKGISRKDLDSISIEDLPVIDKNIVMNNFDDMLVVRDISKKKVMNFLQRSKSPNELLLDKYHVVHSSGSSGKIGVYIYSRRDWDEFYPYITRALDFKFRKKKASYIGAVDGHYSGISFISWITESISRFFCEPLILDINAPIEDNIKKLNRFQPDILGGYFTGLKILAEYQEKGMLQVKPKVVENCAEGINTKDKEYIENIFDASLVNIYGFAECPAVGAGKNEYGGIYIWDDLAYIEIKKDHLLLTNLFNYTQPLIRYKIGDILKVKEDKKQILPFTLIDNIIGREEFVPWFRNKDGRLDFIHPFIFVEFFIKGLDKLQIVVKDEESFDFLAVISDKNKEKVVKNIKRKLDGILRKKNFMNVKYSVKVVNDLKIDKKTGKFKLIVKE